MKALIITTFIMIMAVSCGENGGNAPGAGDNGTFVVGDRGPANGFIFYVNPTASTDGWTYLEAAPADIAGGAVHSWGKPGTSVAGTSTAIGTGQANTDLIVAVMNGGAPVSNTAAQLCNSYSINGYSDWFLPSRNELNEMYEALEVNGLGNFENDPGNDPHYWTSSENGSTQGDFQWFSDGYQANAHKSNPYRVRPVRQF